MTSWIKHRLKITIIIFTSWTSIHLLMHSFLHSLINILLSSYCGLAPRTRTENILYLLLCSSIFSSLYSQLNLIWILTQFNSDFFYLHVVSKLVFVFLEFDPLLSLMCSIWANLFIFFFCIVEEDLSTLYLNSWALEKLVLLSFQ